jgi:tetratricopeptide (TPR) repeat protein
MRFFGLLILTTMLAAGSTPEWQQHFSAAEKLIESGDYIGAGPELELALAQAELTGPTDSTLPMTLRYAANLDVAMGRYREGEARYRRAISIYEQYHPELPAGLARTLQSFGELYSAERQWSRAEPLYIRAHDLLVKSFGPDHYLVGRVLMSMGRLAQELRQRAKAEQLYTAAMGIFQKQTDKPVLDIADLEQNMAMLYGQTGRFDRSGEMFEAAIAAYRQIAPQHPNLAIILKNYAEVQAARKDSPGAERSYREALQICEISLGPDNPWMADILDSYSGFLSKNKRGKEARPLAAKARTILENSSTGFRAQDVVDWRDLTGK